MLAPRKRSFHLLLTLTSVLVLFFLYNRNANEIYSQLPSFGHVGTIAENAPANSTLGFGAVIVVSKEGSSRRPALLQAANVTDIQLTIPSQPQWTSEDVDNFKAGPESKLGRGSILAWLGHHNALRWFLDSGLETALILEDDVDWDIRLRSIQAPLAATAARAMLPPEKPAFSFSQDVATNRQQYWGNHKDWDLLYLGHCGDYFGPVTYDGILDMTPDNLTNIPHNLYIDPSLPSRQDLHPFTADLFKKFELPEQTRIFHRSRFPLCSFGYAVNRPAAERLLTDLAPAKEPPIGTKNRPSAFDIALLHACVNGSKTESPTDPKTNPYPYPNPALRHKFASTGLRCWSLNSELFHHMPGDSQIQQEDVLANKHTGVPPVDHMGADQVYWRQETSNIGCGFWNGAFKFDEGDTKRLEYLQEEVGRKGKCLKEGRDSA